MEDTPGDSWIMIRRALPEESRLLSELALRSKAHWGYDADFIEACRPLLIFTPDDLANHPFFVAEVQGTILGFYSLAEAAGEVELDTLFVEPDAIGRGYGKRLLRHAADTAAARGFRALLIESDPFAEPFYRAMGAVPVGERRSPLDPERRLPLLRLELNAGER
jgi:GNAT superfamily N-acetyltransferase